MDTEGDKLNIYYQNVRGLRSKSTVFYRNVCLNSYHLIVLTETWLLDGVSNSELFDDRYIVWRRDRNYSMTGQSRGGGVLIAVRKDLEIRSQPEYLSSAEDLWITLTVKPVNGRRVINLHLCVLYLCKQSLGFSFSTQLSHFLSKLGEVIISHPDDKYLIIGDFNMSSITWLPISGVRYLSPININSVDETTLIDDLTTHDLKQYNGCLNKYGKILDLVLANDAVVVTECDDPLVPIDPYHSSLLIGVQFVEIPLLKANSYIKYAYDKGNYDSINREISERNWITELCDKPLDEAVDYFYSILHTLHTKHIPSRQVRGQTFPKWYSQALRKVIKEKYKYLRKFKTYKNSADLQAFMCLRDRAKKLEQSCYQYYVATVEDSIEKAPKHFWSFIKSRTKSNSIPNNITYNGTTATTGGAICNLFSSYFFSTFLSPSTPGNVSSDLSAQASPQALTDISSISINESEVAKILVRLDPSKSAGSDHIHSIFLIKCAESLAVPITIIFKRSIRECIFPQVWKSAFITPTHKKGSKTDATNYRPISKLCIISKVFERIVYDQVYSALKGSFTPFQHGFLKGRSTVSNLILFNDYLTSAMDSGDQVDVVYTDYSKAFDRIDHIALISKLRNIGIHGDLLRWFSSYISMRSQAIVINSYMSSWVLIPSGVPQGSLLGPLLFVIFVNDISQCLHNSKLLCFADDMKVFLNITSSVDVQALQEDLSRLDEYCRLNKLDLNPSKCSVTTFSRKRNSILSVYKLKDQILQQTHVVRDLGVIQDSKLLFDEHISHIVAKASKALGFIMRSSVGFKKAKTLKILYCTFVRSILEYASQVWNPRYNKYIMRLERVQMKFIKFLCFRLHIPYNSDNYLQLCKQFHILPLSIRREISDTTFLLKIASAQIDCPDLISKIHLNVPSRFCRFTPLLSVPVVGTNYRQNAFIYRASNNFNILCKADNSLDLDLFCTSVDSARRLLSRDFFA